MLGRGKLEQEARERGFDSVKDMLESYLVLTGSIGGVAGKIGVSPNAVSVWIATHGYEVERKTTARLVPTLAELESA